MSDEQLQSREELLALLQKTQLELIQAKESLKNKNDRVLQIRTKLLDVIDALSSIGTHAERNAQALIGIKTVLGLMQEIYLLVSDPLTSNVDNIPF